MVEKTILCKECNKEALTKFGKSSWRKVNGKRFRVQSYRCNSCGYIGALVRDNGNIVFKVIDNDS